MSNNKLIVSKEELSLVGTENMLMKPAQMNLLLKKTPAKYIKERPAKGGGKWKYVSGGYVKKSLNLMFGWNWSFVIVNKEVIAGEAIVHGYLECISNGHKIVKHQFGNKEVMYKKQYGDQVGQPKEPLSIGNDFKAAATDCLKKCAAEIGIAADIYNPEEFRDTRIVEDKDLLVKLKSLFDLNKHQMSEDYRLRVEEVINNEEKESYQKLIKDLGGEQI